MPSRADAFEQQLLLNNQGLKAQRAGVSISVCSRRPEPPYGRVEKIHQQRQIDDAL